MTSGPTKIPPQQIPGQAANASPPARPPGGPNVLLEKLPEQLADVKKTVEIRGRVIKENRDGTLDIRTDKGDVTVRADARELNIRQGDEVEIEIPPGRPPQEARVTRETEIIIPRAAQTPVNVEVRPASPDVPQPLPATLNEGQVVRLQPVPPAEASQYVPLPAEVIATMIPEIVAAKTDIIVQEVQHFITQEIIAVAAQAIDRPVGIPPAVLQPASVLPRPPILSQGLPQLEAVLARPALLPPILSGVTPANIGIPSPVFTLPQGPVLPFAPITAEPLIPNFAAVNAFRAQIAAVNFMPSPALVTPKIPPSPTITPETLAKIFEKPMILQNHKAGEMPAVVTGFTPQKLPVISLFTPTAGESFFIMHVPGGAATPGTEIILTPQQPLPATAPVTATVTFAPASPLSFLTPETWPLMDEIYRALAQIMPRAAQAMSNMTPSPQNPANLGPVALFFIAAVRAGDLSQWLGGNSVDALRRGGKSGLLNRLGQESSSLNRLASENVSQEWRALSLPLMFENQMHKIALYYKNDSERGQNDEGGKQTRFIFDLNLDAMGKVQLDGLFRAKRLDLIVRTLTPLSVPMQQDMRRLYAGALGNTQITGDLSFQNNPAQWVTITPENKSNLGISA